MFTHQTSMCSLADESLVEANRAAQAAAVARLPAQKQTTVSCAQPLGLSHFSPAHHITWFFFSATIFRQAWTILTWTIAW